eukprot:g1225.t1
MGGTVSVSKKGSATFSGVRSKQGRAALPLGMAESGASGAQLQQRVFEQAKERAAEQQAAGQEGEDLFTDLGDMFGARMATRAATKIRFTSHVLRKAGHAQTGTKMTFARGTGGGTKGGRPQRRYNMVVKRRAARIDARKGKVVTNQTAAKMSALKDEDRAQLLECLRFFLFKGVQTHDIEEEVIEKFYEHVYIKGDNIIAQGDDHQHFFHVVAEGDLDILVDDKFVSKAGPGHCLGELSLVFRTAPNATVRVASQTARTWSLQGDMFRQVLHQSVVDSSLRRAEWFGSLPHLTSLTPYQLSELSNRFELLLLEPGYQVPPVAAENVMFVFKGEVVASSLSGSRNFRAGQLCSPARLVSLNDEWEGVEEAIDEGAEMRAGRAGAQCLHVPVGTFESVLGREFGAALDASCIVSGLQGHHDFAHLNRVQLQGLATRANVVELAAGQVHKHSKLSSAFVLKGQVAAVQAGAGQGRDKSTKLSRKSSFVAVQNLFKETASDGGDGGPSTVQELRAGDTGARLAVMDKWMVREVLDGLDIDEKSVLARDDPGRLKRLRQDIPIDSMATVGKLGEGTFGRVTLTKHGSEYFALKCMAKSHIIENEQEQHVVDERRILMACDHPFVVGLVATHQSDKALYLVLDYCAGGELWSVIHEQHSYENPMHVDRVQFYSACITAALRHMHLNGIIYRDLKPENVLISRSGYAKLTDMGLAKSLPYLQPPEKEGDRDRIFHKTFTVCGTPEYISPEIIYNVGHDRTVDYWALGVLTFELLSGITPFASVEGDLVILFKNICVTKAQAYWSESKRIRQLPFPPEARTVTPELKSFVAGLLNGDVSCRLGSGGFDELTKHKFFKTMDWEALEAQRLEAPWKPDLKDEEDISAFTGAQQDDEEPVWELEKCPPITDCEYFDGF